MIRRANVFLHCQSTRCSNTVIEYQCPCCGGECIDDSDVVFAFRRGEDGPWIIECGRCNKLIRISVIGRGKLVVQRFKGRMQPKDISDLSIIEFINKFDGMWCNWFNFEEIAYNNERSVWHVMPKGTSGSVVISKMRQLLRRGLIDGCGCGCHGDFHLLPKGRDWLLARRPGIRVILDGDRWKWATCYGKP